MPRFQRTRGVPRTFAFALRDAEKWDTNPLVGPSVFLSRLGEGELAEATSDLAAIAADEASASGGSRAALFFQELRSKKVAGFRD